MSRRSTTQRDRMRARIRKTKANCHICGDPIDYDLPSTDEKSFVIDHVIPLAKGGEDALSNVKAAHRRPVIATARSAQGSSPQS